MKASDRMNRFFDRIKDCPVSPCLFYPLAGELGLSLTELLTNPEKQSRALIHLANRYPSGCVIRMTELWCEAAAFRMEYQIDKGFPRLGAPLYTDPEELESIFVPPVENPVLTPLIEAAWLTVSTLSKPLVVGVTGPYTLGSVLNGPEDFMMNCVTEPETAHGFLGRLTGFLTEYILAYKNAGAAAVLLAEPSVAMISPSMAADFSNPYIQHILDRVQDERFSVIYHNCGAVNAHLEGIAALSAHGFHFGSEVDLDRAMKVIPGDRFVMGNVDPRLFLGNHGETIRKTVNGLCERFGPSGRFVCSTGCDLSPNAKTECLEALFG